MTAEVYLLHVLILFSPHILIMHNQVTNNETIIRFCYLGVFFRPNHQGTWHWAVSFHTGLQAI